MLDKNKKPTQRMKFLISLSFFLSLFLVFLSVNSQAHCIGSTTNFTCGDTVTESCVMNESDTAAGTCFTIGANNIVLDCNGYEINYSISTLGYAVNNSDGYDNTTIKNCKINGFNYYWGTGIYFVNSVNSSFINNVIKTNINGMAADAIYLKSCHNALVENNTMEISFFYVHGVYLYYSDNASLKNNTIIQTNSGYNENQLGAPVLIYYSKNATLQNNKLNHSYAWSLYVGGYDTPEYYQHTIGEDNLAQGLPIKYFANVNNQVFENLNYSGYGEVFCGNCNNVTFRNCYFENQGLTLISAPNSRIENSTFATGNYAGIFNSGASLVIDRVNITSNNFGIYCLNSFNTINVTNSIINIPAAISGYAAGFKWSYGANYNLINNTIITNGATGVESYSGSGVSNVINNTIIVNGNAPGYFLWLYGTTVNMTNNYIETRGSGSAFHYSYIWGCPSQYQWKAYVKDTVLNASGSGTDVLFDAGTCGIVNFTNVTFTDKTINTNANSNFTFNVHWYLDAQVNYTNGTAVEEANVSAWDNNNNLVFTELTNSSGAISRQTLLEYTQNITGTYYKTNYSINARKDFFFSNSTEQVNLTTNKLVQLWLIPRDVVVYLIEPENNARTYEAKNEFTCNATSRLAGNISEITFHIYNSDNEPLYNETYYTANDSESENHTFTYELPYGDTFYWKCSAESILGIQGESETWAIRYFTSESKDLDKLLWLVIFFIIIPIILIIFGYWKNEPYVLILVSFLFIIGGVYLFLNPLGVSSIIDLMIAFVYFGLGTYFLLSTGFKIVAEGLK